MGKDILEEGGVTPTRLCVRIMTICSVDNIDCVNIDFEEGDHAFPGDYCR